MFHVDAKANTLVTGTDTLRVGDDVIVTYNGNLGVGTIPPTLSDTRLIVTDGGTPAAPKSPLRIIDGKQAEGRVFTSNAGGQGQWAELPATFSLGQAYGLYGIPAKAVSGTMDLGFSFTANATGFYSFEVRWWARVQDASLGGSYVPQHFRLLRNNVEVDQFEAYTNSIGGAQDYCTYSFILYSEVTQVNQVFRMTLRPGYFPVVTEDNGSTPWTRAWINIVRMY
jgi:hypothetical protein